jgi:hypothetical protein
MAALELKIGDIRMVIQKARAMFFLYNSRLSSRSVRFFVMQYMFHFGRHFYFSPYGYTLDKKYWEQWRHMGCPYPSLALTNG